MYSCLNTILFEDPFWLPWAFTNPSVTLLLHMFQDYHSSFLKDSKNNHLQWYIISKSNNNNDNNKQDLKALRNSIRLLNQTLIFLKKYGQNKKNKTHKSQNISSTISSINIYKSFFRLHLNYRDMIYETKHAILLVYNAAVA